MSRFALCLLAILLLPTACLHPQYRRPDLPIPPGYRGGDTAEPIPGGSSLGELRWQDLVRDERLNELISQALANNYDVRIAAARVLEAGAQAADTRSQRFPNVEGQIGYSNLRAAKKGISPLPKGYPPESDYKSVFSMLSWEIDLWGRLRNANTASRARLLASVEAHRIVMQSLVSQVSQAYFLLRDLDLEREIAQRSLRSRKESLDLVQLRVENGYSSEMELRQAEVLVKSAQTACIDLERQSEQAENLMSILLGRSPGAIPRGSDLHRQDPAVSLPSGLPSSLLERRPDIRQAEQELIAANAEVAVSKAAFFPRLSITASSGFESPALLRLLNLENGSRVFGPIGNLPIFNAGRVRAGVRGARARKEQAVLNYQRTVIQAFREVADALVGYRKLLELRREQVGLVDSLRRAVELADLRYRGGVSSYLEYLDSERQLLDAELRLAQIRRDESTSVITLYCSLGGGWQ